MSKEIGWYEITVAECDLPISEGQVPITEPRIIGFRALYEMPPEDYEVVDGVTAQGHVTHTYIIEHFEDEDEFVDHTNAFDHGTVMMALGVFEGNEKKVDTQG